LTKEFSISNVLVGFGVGVLCGVLIPELNRVEEKGILLGIYSSSEATGISVK